MDKFQKETSTQPIEKGKEPDDIKRRLDRLIPKLREAYSDGIVKGLETSHKKWAETIRDIRKKLGYQNTVEFLDAYGFKLEKNKAGRPKTTSAEVAKIIEELHRRYPDGPEYQTVHELIVANPDLKGQLKTLYNQSLHILGLSFGNYLKKEGLLGDGQKLERQGHRLEQLVQELNKRYPTEIEKPERYADLVQDNQDLKIPSYSMLIKSIHGKTPKAFFGELGFVNTAAETERKRIRAEQRAQERKANPRIPMFFQEIKNLLDQNAINRASMAIGSGYFFYETTCPTCGKSRLMQGPAVDWHYHQVGTFSPEDWKKRNKKVQGYLDKYGISLQLDDSLFEDFSIKRGTCECQLLEPHMDPFCDVGDYYECKVKKLCADGSMTLHFEVYGTGKDNRSKRIEQLSPGDPVLFSIDGYDWYDSDGGGDDIHVKYHISIFDCQGDELGEIPSPLSQQIAPFVDSGQVMMDGGYITKIQTRAQRGCPTGKALLFVSLTLRPTDSKKPMGWLIKDRLYDLCLTKGYTPLYYRSQTKLIAPAKEQLAHYGFEKAITPECQRLMAETLLFGPEYGDCMYCAEEVSIGEKVVIRRIGTLEDGSDTLLVYTADGNLLGRIESEFSTALALLMDTGHIQIIDPVYEGRVEKEQPEGRPSFLRTKIRFLLIIDTKEYADIYKSAADEARWRLLDCYGDEVNSMRDAEALQRAYEHGRI